jgi:hypothetical protein
MAVMFYAQKNLTHFYLQKGVSRVFSQKNALKKLSMIGLSFLNAPLKLTNSEGIQAVCLKFSEAGKKYTMPPSCRKYISS